MADEKIQIVEALLTGEISEQAERSLAPGRRTGMCYVPPRHQFLVTNFHYPARRVADIKPKPPDRYLRSSGAAPR